MNATTHQDQIKTYYGKVLKTQNDLKTGACCCSEAPPTHIREILELIDEEVLEKFYGCGSPIPEGISGCTIMDLGCGTGRDVFVCSQLVGSEGKVIGVDMTIEQLQVATKSQPTMARKFGHFEPNTTFLHGCIEDLQKLDIPDNSIDVVISNCVINLSFDKPKLLQEIYRVLKPGGELYFSDVFTSRRLPEHLQTDPTLIGECIGGAFYSEDFRRLATATGWKDIREMKSNPIDVHDPKIMNRLGNIKLFPKTLRLFKLDTLEDRCEDYGQCATYLGSIPHCAHNFSLDDHHHFETGKPMLVCGNTAAMLNETRFAKHFKVVGDRSTHFGLFDCTPVSTAPSDQVLGGCC